jgi:hypothetical protein
MEGAAHEGSEMMNLNLQLEGMSIQAAIEQRAAELVRDGIALPWDAVIMAREEVMRERRKAAARRTQGER